MNSFLGLYEWFCGRMFVQAPDPQRRRLVEGWVEGQVVPSAAAQQASAAGCAAVHTRVRLPNAWITQPSVPI